MDNFPIEVTQKDLLPESIWPDLFGIEKAESEYYENSVVGWKKFIKLAKTCPLVAIDTETDGLWPFHGNQIIGSSAAFFKDQKIHAGYWNFRHSGHEKHPYCGTHETKNRSKNCNNCKRGVCPGYKESAKIIPTDILQDLNEIFESKIIAGQNLKFDLRMLSMEGIRVPNRTLDTILIAHLFDENKIGYSLDSLAKEIGELKLTKEVETYALEHGINIKETGHRQIPYEVERPYAIADVVVVLKRLQWERQRWKSLEDPKVMKIFQIENACTPAFAQMEIHGMQIDLDFTREGAKKLQKEILKIEKEIYIKAGEEFDINSTQQLWKILEIMGKKPVAYTPAGQPALGDTELTAYNDPFCDLIKAYRARYKMLHTYFLPFLEDHCDSSGKIHGDFFIHGTVSGRASSRDPNLQNIPRFEKFGSRTRMGTVAKAIQSGMKNEEMKNEDTLETRRCFIPRQRDYSLFFFDYAQMELRLFAELAGEEFLLKTLEQGGDIHEATARKVFHNFPEKESDPKLYEYFRQLAKQINFGIIYGMGRNKLAVQLNVPTDETVRILEIAQQGFRQVPEIISRCTNLNLEQVQSYLEDHRIMTRNRNWPGLRILSSEVIHRINERPTQDALCKDGQNTRLLYSAEKFLNSYHQQFPRIKQVTKEMESVIRSRGYIFNRYGRRYHLSSDKSYVGVNRWVQGTCADMVKLAQHRIHWLLKNKKSKMINQVHDEIQIDLSHEELDLIPQIKNLMETFSDVKVKMQVDIDYSHLSWADKREWTNEKEFSSSLPNRDDASKKQPRSRKPRKVLSSH